MIGYIKTVVSVEKLRCYGIWLMASVIGLAVFSGCKEKEVEEEKYSEQFLRKDWPVEKIGNPTKIRRGYRIRSGDKVEIIYNVKTMTDTKDYKLKVRDIISVRFPYVSNLTQIGEEVQSDGTVNLLLIGQIKVFDRTIKEVQGELKTKYRAFIKDPELTVSFKESKRDIFDLRDAIKTAPRGQSRLVPVAPDGTIALPLIGTVLAGGLTIDELHAAINKAYHTKPVALDELEVTVNLEMISPLRVYVMGEVARPGLVFNTLGAAPNVTEMSLMMAIAQAGSYKPKRAELSKVLLIRRKNLAYPQTLIVNLRQLLESPIEAGTGKGINKSAAFRRDLWLEDGDVVYVPTKKIAERADYIEYVWTRGIYAVVPMTYSITANYNAADAVDWLGPNP
jgi:polysaccharide export outer membrane protein